MIKTKSFKNNIYIEAESIISDKWTDGISIVYGSTKFSTEIYCGNSHNAQNDPIQVNDTLLYDLSSVTKLLSLITVLKLLDDGYINLDKKISEYSKLLSYPHLQELHLYELMNFSKTIVTPDRISEIPSEEAQKALHQSYIESNETKYSDIGSMILFSIVEDLFGNGFIRQYTRSLWDRFGLKHTYWWDDVPKNGELLQSYDSEYRYDSKKHLIIHHTPIGQPHDPKSRIIVPSGHAGIFMSPGDMNLFCKELMNYRILSKKSILNYICNPKYDSLREDSQHFGLLCYKKANNPIISEVPPDGNNSCIAMSGYTGTYLLLDFENNAYLFIGSNRIYKRLTSKESNQGTNDDKNPEYIRNSHDYVYRKDKLRDMIYSHLIQS